MRRLRQLRKEKNVSIETLMAALGLKTKSAYYKKESGAININLREAKIIADILKIPINDIFFGS